MNSKTSVILWWQGQQVSPKCWYKSIRIWSITLLKTNLYSHRYGNFKFWKGRFYIPLVIRWSSKTYSSKHILSHTAVLVCLTFLNYCVSRGKEKGQTYNSGISILEAKKHNLICYEWQGWINPLMKQEHQSMECCLCNGDNGWCKSSTVQHNPELCLKWGMENTYKVIAVKAVSGIC